MNKKAISRSTGPVRHYPRNAREALEVHFLLDMLLTAVTFFARLIGSWRYPVGSDGRFENMTLYDKIRYVYKAQYPVMLAEPGSGIEKYFSANRQHPLPLPQGFRPADRLTFNAVGDLIPHDLLPESGAEHYGDLGAELFDADVTFANLEAPVIPGSRTEFKFRQTEAPSLGLSPSQFEVLKGADGNQFTILATANNHTLDYGLEGLSNTLDTVIKAGIRTAGTDFPGNGQSNGIWLDAAGFRIGVVAATFGLNGKPVPPGNSNCVNVIPFTRPTGEIDLSLFQRQFDQLRQDGCELLVASVHWGKEYEFFPTARQVKLGHRIAELGADIVLGHHPHNIQPVEIYHVGPVRRAIICHSLGNLTSPFSAPYLVTSLLVRISVVRGILADRQYTLIESVDPIPIFQDCKLRNGVRQTRLMRLTTALGGGNTTERASAEAGACYADLVLGPYWRDAK